VTGDIPSAVKADRMMGQIGPLPSLPSCDVDLRFCRQDDGPWGMDVRMGKRNADGRHTAANARALARATGRIERTIGEKSRAQTAHR
jgi:hypothetical protein